MIEKDRITLIGDRICHGRMSKVRAVLLGSSCASVLISSLLSMAINEVCSPQQTMTQKLIQGALFLAAATVNVERVRNIRHEVFAEFFPDWKDKVINMSPDNNTSPTQEKWLTFAKAEKRVSEKMLIKTSAALIAILAAGLALSMPWFASTGTACVGGWFCEQAFGSIRSRKVLNFDWVIEDKGPPPEKVPVREKVRGFVQRLFPKTAPAGAS